MKQERIDPDWAWTKKYGISPGVKVGDTVYLSGNSAFDNDGNIVGEGDVYAQSKKTFENIAEALASVGSSMRDIVKITTYLTDISSYPEFAKAGEGGARFETYGQYLLPNGLGGYAAGSYTRYTIDDAETTCYKLGRGR